MQFDDYALLQQISSEFNYFWNLLFSFLLLLEMLSISIFIFHVPINVDYKFSQY